MRFRLLGPVEITDDDGRPLRLGPPAQRAVLAALLLHAGSRLTLDRLIDLLWGEQPPDTAATMVHGYVAGLRRVLEADAGPPRVIVTQAGSYELRAGHDDVDSLVFERLLAEGRRVVAGDPRRGAELLRQALALWRGPALADVRYDFAVAAARRLDDLRLDAVESRIEADIACGRHREVTAEIEALVSEHPERDRLRALLMLALYGCGRQAEALRAYEDARRWTAEELGADPAPELSALHEAILRQEATIFGLDQTPHGVLTFLLTDIEDSTPLWEHLPDAMRVAHARHNEIVRDVALQHRGDQPREQGEGDSAVLVFRGPRDAIACAIELQRAMVSEPWPPEAEINVRVAIHSGEAEQRDGTYHGLAIARCARVRALAAGGQILLTGATADLVGDALPAKVSLRDLGRYDLKGLSRPERVWQLVHPDLRDDFPALRGTGGRNNLPAALTSFLGRSAELTHITQLLERERLVTLTGPGGSGKTRLAVEAARTIAQRFDGGGWLVDLTPLGSPDLIADAIAEALGVRAEGTHSPLEALVTAISGRDVLVVLDNCEHLLEGCADVAAAMLAGAPGVRLLATSREALSVSGETVYPVSPLSVPGDDASWDRVASADAARLFAERASAARSGFVVNQSNAHLVSELCRRLDGMPLALELAAARVASLPLRHIVENLDDRFRLLESATRSALPRHRSLAAVVDWSYDLLNPQERLLFDRLSVFSGPFGLDAAREVVAGDELQAAEVTNLLGGLVARSLVHLEDTGLDIRYRTLETLRQYGAARLEDRGVADAVRARHAQYFLRFVEEGRPRTFHAGSSEWFDQLSAEYDNLRAALEWSFGTSGDVDVAKRFVYALAFYWEQRSIVREAIYWLDLAVRITEGVSTPERAVFLGMVASARAAIGDFDEAARLGEAAAALAYEIGPQTSLCVLEGFSASSWSRGIAAWARGDLERARDIHAEARVEFETAVARAEVPEALWHLTTSEILLARVLRDIGSLDEAERLADLALTHARECGEDLTLGLVLDIAASIAHRRGELARARVLVDESLERQAAVGYAEGRASALGVAGRLALEAGDIDAAARAFTEALDHARRIGLPGGVAAALEGSARTLLRSDDAESAALLFGGADAIRRAIGAQAPASERAEQEHDRREVEERLGRDAFNAALSRGASLGLDELAEVAAGARRIGAGSHRG